MIRGRDVDKHAGRRISALRDSLRVTQSGIAAQMTALGHAWHQQTVVKIEKGTRPLRLAEAVDLANLLRVDVTVLLDDSDLAPVGALRARVVACETAHREALAAASRAAAARARLAETVDAVGAQVPADLREVAHAALRVDLAEEIRTARAPRSAPPPAAAPTLRPARHPRR